MTNISQNKLNKKIILITGADGFIGKNLLFHLIESGDYEVLKYIKSSKKELLKEFIFRADYIVHLAGTNRSDKDQDFEDNNIGVTEILCNLIKEKYAQTGLFTPLFFTSSIHATKNNIYGKTKLKAEKKIIELFEEIKNPIFIIRLPGVFGKWCKPNYNSVVATFCFNISRNKSIRIDNKEEKLYLVYIDDVVRKIIEVISSGKESFINQNISPQYEIKLGDLVEKIKSFKEIEKSNIIPETGSGLTRALYSTYISYLPEDQFSYNLENHKDSRGIFSEIIKTKDYGQFSFFTINIGFKRGCHYHHTKTEKFLIVSGSVKFTFYNLLTKNKLEINSDSENNQIINSIPGWYHDIENIGDSKAIVFLWTNEIFDSKNPDTISYKLD